MPVNEQSYLGDGLYADFDGEMVTLSTVREGNVRHWVALEVDVLESFQRFLKRNGLPNAAPE